ncbi:hypothetical protein G6F57_011207 [Rhizopus arrhizus]|uniref:Uncharacterized protein n=1 Tax=Rhizopus oryzae TaxID=64495 RepID=A0A9P7BM77_RHIOR|nr:hypothetical protein G6F23_010578 [Rhizopus arrhizus]KAG0758372.1 hypothetical protein G6F24_009844 [Rhizopus arrhizus]KAG0779825.1 hypothetical protein G6F22_010422 [Rhizopus arrhizus]KAG0780923.1 hypothetical protein G6F21_011908 [Rhizopus arrhizus]KAG0826674.1 hypothetical protein G6F18_009844 [Rhizopus arrhizus]
MAADIHMEDFNSYEEQTAETHTCLMSVMRMKFKVDEAAMEIDEEIVEDVEIDERNKEQNEVENLLKVAISDFIKLIVDMVPVKVASSKKVITTSTTYWFRKIWNENQESPKKKRDPAKGEVLKDERPLPIIKLADDFADKGKANRRISSYFY